MRAGRPRKIRRKKSITRRRGKAARGMANPAQRRAAQARNRQRRRRR